jgi:hypothetical protein
MVTRTKAHDLLAALDFGSQDPTNSDGRPTIITPLSISTSHYPAQLTDSELPVSRSNQQAVCRDQYSGNSVGYHPPMSDGGFNG